MRVFLQCPVGADYQIGPLPMDYNLLSLKRGRDDLRIVPYKPSCDKMKEKNIS